jgi:hypothetical protein
MANASGPCEKAADILTDALFKDIKAPAKAFVSEELKRDFVKSFKAMKEDFLVEIVPKLNDAKELIAGVEKAKGTEKINQGSAMLIYYAASQNIGKEEMPKFLDSYRKNGADVLARHMASSKEDAVTAILTYEGKVTEQIVASYRSALFRHKGAEEAETGKSDVLYQKTGTG